LIWNRWRNPLTPAQNKRTPKNRMELSSEEKGHN
jgi:hypothetical protein